jgi:hypothetical protein
VAGAILIDRAKMLFKKAPVRKPQSIALASLPGTPAGTGILRMEYQK